MLAIKYAINDLPRFGGLVQSMDNPVVWICGTAEMWAPFFFVVATWAVLTQHRGTNNLRSELSLHSGV